jgi:hypothetical protein
LTASERGTAKMLAYRIVSECATIRLLCRHSGLPCKAIHRLVFGTGILSHGAP